MKKIFFLLSLLCMGMAVAASPLAGTAVLRGLVTDAVDGQPVIGASIYFPLLKQGTVTNAEGRYELTRLPRVKTTVQVSFVGHQTIIETIDLRLVSTRDFVLHEKNAMLGRQVAIAGVGRLLTPTVGGPLVQHHRCCGPSAGRQPDYHG